MPADPTGVLAPASRLHQLLLCEAIRRQEERGEVLNDGAATLNARQANTSFPAKIQARALNLARDSGQLQSLQRWLRTARAALVGLLILAAVSGVGFAVAALGGGRVNLAWALGCLLGMHLVSLTLWIISLSFGRHLFGTLVSQGWLWLSSRVDRQGASEPWTASLVGLREGARAGRWGIALVTHGWWLVALSFSALTVVALLVIRRYSFAWETTLLNPDTFVAVTHRLGALPALLGFSLPSEAMIRASSEANIDHLRFAWSSWLLGVLLVYGVALRLLLALFSWHRWVRAKAALELDLDQPGYALLRDRLMPTVEHLGINDPASDVDAANAIVAAGRPVEGAFLVGIELDGTRPWPPALPEGVIDLGVLDSREQRRQLLTQIALRPAARLVIACDPQRSPDRGTVALIRELAAGAAQTRLWLSPLPGQAVEPRRIETWHSALQGVVRTTEAPLHWLVNGDD
ncbi:MAG: DUF2868 domain-containing protein [Gammaproteobacteria bacterium]|nr:DUF2868 domain-containing protein [Gammaproteobacteria bacterium]